MRAASRAHFGTRGGGPREIVVWCSNDYLGMGRHPSVIEAMREAASQRGAGAGGTRNISGNSHEIVMLERELADLHGKEQGLVFTSGYVSNATGIATIVKLIPDCVVISDELNHNSMIEGVRQGGRQKAIFRHNDLAHLEELLQAAGNRPKVVVFESVYSMDGDIAPHRGHLRSGRALWRHDLSRRSACGRHVRAARRWRCRA